MAFHGSAHVVLGVATIAWRSATVTAAPPSVESCQLFPADNIWNVPIDDLPVDPNSSAYISTIGVNVGLHPDFGTVYEGAPIGIPFIVVPFNQPMVDVVFDYDDESDPGPYPIPPDAPIEGGPNSDGDRHILIIREGDCTLYELFYAWPQEDGTWTAGSGAIFNLNGNALRPDTWTSADAAGLPVLPGLVRYEEVISGEIKHALRFTCVKTRKAHLWPARHDASSSTDPARPPMGQRFRLKADFNISGYHPHVQVILTALKKYGMMLADNGSNWFITGVPNPLWDDDILVGQLASVKGSNFEAVDVSSLMIDPDSAETSVCMADTTADGTVDFDDLLTVIDGWSACADPCPPSCQADTTGDCQVNTDDLLTVINGWGDCS